MVYKKTKQKVRRVYSRSKSILNGNILKNPAFIGAIAGVVKNAATGKKIIDIERIKQRISKLDGSNPLIFLGLGLFAKNPALTAIGAYAIVDPPDVQENEEHTEYSNIGKNEETTEYSNIGGSQETVEYSNIGENEELSQYSNVGENDKTASKKRFVY